MSHSNRWTVGTVISATGIVYGDIGTSPLYALEQSLGAAGPFNATFRCPQLFGTGWVQRRRSRFRSARAGVSAAPALAPGGAQCGVPWRRNRSGDARARWRAGVRRSAGESATALWRRGREHWLAEATKAGARRAALSGHTRERRPRVPFRCRRVRSGAACLVARRFSRR